MAASHTMARALARPDIEVLPEYLLGKDHIIGDLHGSLYELNKELKTLGPHDRLFIAGDLINRGEDSYGVIHRIVEWNKRAKQIFAIRGNHEEIFKRFYEIEEDETLLKRAIGGDWVLKIDSDQLQEVRDYIDSLPYIIHVEGFDPFHVVHADMPFSDTELTDRIKNKKPFLSEEEKEYAVWAREKNSGVLITDKGRTPTSMIAYCGHTILGGVRKQTAHVNLDVGTYHYQSLCSANHQTGTVFPKGNLEEKIQRMASSTQFYLLPRRIKKIFEHKDFSLEQTIEKINSLTSLVFDSLKGDPHKRMKNILFLADIPEEIAEQLATDLCKKRNEDAAEKKAKSIEREVLELMKNECEKKGTVAREAYVRSLKKLTLDSPFLFSDHVKVALGKLLAENKEHMLYCRLEHNPAFFRLSPEESVHYLNRALGILNLPPVKAPEEESEEEMLINDKKPKEGPGR